jgi:HNH endonuclease
MDNTSKKKAQQLEMPYGTARNRLNKAIMFELMKRCKLDICYQCKKKINLVDDLSVEHKIPWLDSEDPVGLFFDLDNIAFSHTKCNYGAARRPEVPPQSAGKIGSSGYKGVSKAGRKASYEWMAAFTYKGKKIHLGCGNDARELAKLYDAKATELLGEDAITNKSLGLLD